MDVKFIFAENKNHIERIVLLANEIWKEHYESLIGLEQVEYMLGKFQSAEYIQKQTDEGFEYYIFDCGEDAGYAGVNREGERVFVSKLYVKNEYRGNGISRQFIEYLKERFSVCDSLYLTVNKGNTGSIEAYKKLGFAITDAVVNDIGNGFFMDDYVMTAPIR